jgi:flagellar capping protein FliD
MRGMEINMIQAYNYLSASLPVKREKYPVSRRNELRRVYDNIINLNKSMPFYKINLTKENQDYSIGVKEAAFNLKVKLTDMTDPQISGFKSKTIAVSDEHVLSANLINQDTEGLPDTIKLQIKSLASVQINKGKELLSTSRGLPPGVYEFKAIAGNETHNLIFYQESRRENQSILTEMADLLNNSIPGINAQVEKGANKDYYRLSIITNMLGENGDKKLVFEDSDIYQDGIVEYFGMNRMEKAPALSEFELNDEKKQTSSNTFNLGNKLHIILKESGEQPVYINIIPDSNRILSSVESVLSSYNKLVNIAKNHIEVSGENYKAKKLITELKSIGQIYSEELASCGITVSLDGTLNMEDSLAVLAAQDGGMESLFSRENGFMARLYEKAENIAINPLEYLDKIIVTYPDLEKKYYSNPYMMSMYSGLFFNTFC